MSEVRNPKMLQSELQNIFDRAYLNDIIFAWLEMAL